MSEVLWVLTIIVSFIVHKTFALPPEVPQTPSWNNLSIEKPRSSVIPTWYDVLVTPQITKEVESKNKTGVSYAELRESLALNQLNLPEVVQKEVVLEAEEIEIPNDNSKNITKKSGTKMKDLYKNRFQKTKKEMKAELMNNYLIPKLAITESPKTNKKQKEYFPKEEKKPLPPLNSSVPLYVPIFRPQTNSKKKTTQRILEKPNFVNPSPNNQETIQNDVKAKQNDAIKQSIKTQIKDKNIEYVPTIEDNVPELQKGSQITVDKEIAQPTNENHKQHNTIENSEENNLINKVIQAIKDGKLKLDEGQLKLNAEGNLPKLLDEKEKSDQQNNVLMTGIPFDFAQSYQQLDKSKTPQFVIQQPINQHPKEPFKPIVVEIMNPQLLNKKPANQQPISESPVYQQSLNQQCVNQQEVKQQSLIEQLVNQQQFNNQPISKSPVHQQPLDQQILNQLLLNHQSLHQQQSMNRQSMHQQSINQQTFHPQTLNQQALNQESLNEQQIIELISQQLMNQQPLNHPPNIQHQQSLNQQSMNQQNVNQQPINQKSINQHNFKRPFNQQSPCPQCVNQQNLNQQSLYQQSLSQQPINQQLLDQQSMHQQCVNQQNRNLDSLNQQQIIELLTQLQLSDSPGTLSHMARSNPDKKIPEILTIPNSSNIDSRIHPRVKNFEESQLEIQNTHKTVEMTQKDNENNPVLTVFKPDTVSLWETYGNFLKKLTMTVLVPVHAEKLLT